MSYVKSAFNPIVISCAIVLGMVAAINVAPWALVAAQVQSTNKVEQGATVDQKQKHGFGRFVSFKDGTLTLESNSKNLIVWNKIGDNIKTYKFDPDANEYKVVVGAVAALNQVKAGKYVMVGDGRAFLRIGARIDKVSGTFVSFKKDRLLLLGKDLPEGFVKRYGNNLHYNRFRDDVPVHESIDGGEYKLIGTANSVLGSVKEGAVLTVHGEGDDNITLIEIGVPKKK